LIVSDSTLSRRLSEFLGVALFALALIWLIALVTYDATDPVWYFTTPTPQAPSNFVGPVGAFLARSRSRRWAVRLICCRSWSASSAGTISGVNGLMRLTRRSRASPC
jgi:peptidoglycan/LPS O-acetylase OafA/YrhL